MRFFPLPLLPFHLGAQTSCRSRQALAYVLVFLCFFSVFALFAAWSFPPIHLRAGSSWVVSAETNLIPVLLALSVARCARLLPVSPIFSRLPCKFQVAPTLLLSFFARCVVAWLSPDCSSLVAASWGCPAYYLVTFSHLLLARCDRVVPGTHSPLTCTLVPEPKEPATDQGLN